MIDPEQLDELFGTGSRKPPAISRQSTGARSQWYKLRQDDEKSQNFSFL